MSAIDRLTLALSVAAKKVVGTCPKCGYHGSMQADTDKDADAGKDTDKDGD